MRKEPYTVGNYIHVYNRGNRKMAITRDDTDCWRFLSILRYFNDERPALNIFRDFRRSRSNLNQIQFTWPENLMPQKPIVKIISYCLMPNHFHLLMEEIIDGGVAVFMKKLGDGYTAYMNIKYKESGKIFQGSYKSKTVNDGSYLEYLDFYIHVLNPFELYQNTIKGSAPLDFDKAYDFALAYPLSGLSESLGAKRFSIIDRSNLENKFKLINNGQEYKKFAYDAFCERGISKFLGDLTLE